MAKVTNWLKQLGRAPRWRWVMLKAVYSQTGIFELWLTDVDNRVLRCALETPEVKALYDQLGKFFERVG
jgi:hypothetical protein